MDDITTFVACTTQDYADNFCKSDNGSKQSFKEVNLSPTDENLFEELNSACQLASSWCVGFGYLESGVDDSLPHYYRFSQMNTENELSNQKGYCVTYSRKFILFL